MDRTSREIYAEKKSALMNGDKDVKLGVEERKDLMSVLCKSYFFPLTPTNFVHLLVRANMEASEEDKLPEEEIIAQVSSVAIVLSYLFLFLFSHEFCKVSYICWNRYDYKRRSQDSSSPFPLSRNARAIAQRDR